MKKVLYITYYWEPCGGIGPLRSLKFARYLRDHGWDPVIFAPENASYPLFDNISDHQLPDDLTILKYPIWEPYSYFNLIQGKKKDQIVSDVFAVSDGKKNWLHDLSIWVRGNFFIPDARKFWVKPSVKFLKKYLKENPVDAIISHGPPHSTHLIALALKKEFGLPWIADFQDPWTQVDYFYKFKLTPNSIKKHRVLEQQVLTQADHRVIVSNSWTNDLAELAGKPVNYIPWGMDPDDFRDFPIYKNDGFFTISHYGTTGSDRNPNALWTALGDLCQEDSEFAKVLRIQLAGSIDISVIQGIEAAGLKNNLDNLGFVPRSTIIDKMSSSEVLLLLLNRAENVKGRIPAKIFEYLAAKRPILVIGPHDADVPVLVRETQSGLTADFDQVQEAKEAIMHFYLDWKKNIISEKFIGIEKYHSKAIAGQMAVLLDQITT